MKTEDIIQYIVIVIIFLTMGFNMVFRRKKIINALVSSSKVFWEKIGYSPDEGFISMVANAMIPIMGFIFIVAGAFSLYKVIIFFLQ